MSSTHKVIIFGATGAVGSAAALEAHNRGAEVFLGMRDTKKPTLGLPSHLKKVQADLTDAASVEKAVKEAGATAAFIYASGQPGSDAIAKALKKAGVEHVVLLSSFSLYIEHHKGSIYQMHHSMEVALQKEGLKCTLIRPMYFTSNIWEVKDAIKAGEIPLTQPQHHDDYIAPEDIGAVAGAKLVSDEAEIIPLCGPKLINKFDAWKIIGEELGKDLKIKELTVDEYKNWLMMRGLPEMVADEWIVYTIMPDEEKLPARLYEPASQNVKKYVGREPITLREWVKKHKNEVDE